MSYIIGVYSNDYLMLFELMNKMNSLLPQVDVRVFCNDRLMGQLPAGVSDYCVSIEGIYECDIVLLLSPYEDDKFYESFDGEIIAVQGAEGIEVNSSIPAIVNPLFTLLTDIVTSNDSVVLTISLPMSVYGKEGVDELMQETRSIYTFEDYDKSVFEKATAFNIQYFYGDLPRRVFKYYIDKLRALANISLRIIPTSTVFAVDIIADAALIIPESTINLNFIENDFALSDFSGESTIGIYKANERFYTIVGDLLSITTDNIVKELDKYIGGFN